ncbi:MAG: DUF1553 domain-containing protein [Planctomycetaceae bacterium]
MRTRKMINRMSMAALLLIVFSGATFAQRKAVDESADTSNRSADFGSAVFGILKRSCFECHGSQKQEGGLRLDSASALAMSGSVVAGSPADSELLRRISLPHGHDEIMPAIGDPLLPKEIDGIRRWIQQGAVWPESFEEAPHWSYVSPVRPVVPDLSRSHPEFPAGGAGSWARNAIDGFVAERLRQEGLQPSVDADPATIVRRLFFDTTGLPPTPQDVNEFVANPTDVEYQRLVDELLSRPQFGEHWARQWLDLARYADSHGFQRDDLRDIWAYRDWVIRALNDDMPFDRFTVEQIAGDLLPDATEAQKIATGFHRCTPTNVEAGSLPEETRIEQVIDRVNTTGAVWLGTTMECCQCHDHKYDPFSQKDYYGLLAFFNNTEIEADRTNPKSPSSIQFIGPKMAITDPTTEAKRDDLKAQHEQLVMQQAAARALLARDLADWAADISGSLNKAPQIHALDVVDFQSTGTVDSHQILDDGSILLVGTDPPENDVYQVTVRTDLRDVTAFRLDALTHESLPGGGPGRGDPVRTNFVLNRFSAEFSEMPEAGGVPSTPSTPLSFSGATADFSQTGWDVAGALNDAARTGWAIAPQFGKSHWAQFRLAEPLDAGNGCLITFTLVHNFGSARSIGRLKLSAMTGEPGIESVPAHIAELVRKSSTQWSDEDREQLVNYRSQHDADFLKLTTEIVRTKKQLSEIEPDTTLVMVELAEPRESYVFERGDYRNKGEDLLPATPKVLHPIPAGPLNRLTLAKWLIDPANPLVARVTVNRWWAQIFGQGIVSTPEDFGVKGDAPTHPELLDWLAVELMENGWSRKKLIRTILLSSTYRQSSFSSDELRERDDANRLLARGPAFRMSAEMIRDNLLAVSGLLDLKQFGPSIRPYQPDGIWSKVGGQNYDYKVSPGSEQYRRGIYVVLKRGAPYPSFINFDASARLACTVRRSRTNTPLQALTLLNDPVYVAAAESLVRRLLNEQKSASIDEQIRHAFQLCTGRRPSENEFKVLLDLWETQHSVSLAATNRRTSGKKTTEELPTGLSTAQFAAWKSVAATLLNLHETITKN